MPRMAWVTQAPRISDIGALVTLAQMAEPSRNAVTVANASFDQ